MIICNNYAIDNNMVVPCIILFCVNAFICVEVFISSFQQLRSCFYVCINESFCIWSFMEAGNVNANHNVLSFHSLV